MSIPNWRLKRWQNRHRNALLRQLIPFGLMGLLMAAAVALFSFHGCGH